MRIKQTNKNNYITEGYFNNTEITSDDTIDDISSEQTGERFQYSLKIGTNLTEREYFEEHIIKTVKKLEHILDNVYFIDDFQLWIDSDYSSETFNLSIEYRTEEEIHSMMDDLWEDDFVCIDIKFSKISNKVRFSDFSKFLSILLKMFKDLFRKSIDYISVNNTVYVERNDAQKVSHLDYVDYSTAFHDMFKDIFGIIEGYAKCNLSYTGPVHLSKNSLKLLKDFRVGDLLFANDNGELISEPEDMDSAEPIACCILSVYDTNKNCAVFSALRYASNISPDSGTIYGSESTVSYGSVGDNVGSTNCDKTAKYSKGGEQATQKMYDYLNNRCYDKNWKSGVISNCSESGFMPIALVAWRFKTKGTQRGNWYIGSLSEYSKMYKDRFVISNKTRDYYVAALGVASIWTCQEVNANQAVKCITGKKTVHPKISCGSVVPLLKVLDK